MTASICLNMIVKNEAHVIRRCLQAVRPFIDTWVIVDTGSTDGTQEIIHEYFKEIPGHLFERPWKNFGHNRSEALELARPCADYLFFIDADDELLIDTDWTRRKLTADAYSMQILHSGVEHWRVSLVSTKLQWKYVGVLHEYLESADTHIQDKLYGARILIHPEGNRSKRTDQRSKFLEDAKVLENALVDEPENARYVFYLAQSYRDAGELKKSLTTYQRRAVMGGWDEEVWYSLYEIAKLSERLELGREIVIERYLQAYQNRFQRAEPLVDLARLFRERQEYVLAHLFADRAVKTSRPNDLLFLDSATYEWRAIDEYAIASYWVGNYEDSALACEQLLKKSSVPVSHLSRITDNLNFAKKKLGQSKRSSALPTTLGS